MNAQFSAGSAGGSWVCLSCQGSWFSVVDKSAPYWQIFTLNTDSLSQKHNCFCPFTFLSWIRITVYTLYTEFKARILCVMMKQFANKVLSSSRAPLLNQPGGREAGQKTALDLVQPSMFYIFPPHLPWLLAGSQTLTAGTASCGRGLCVINELSCRWMSLFISAYLALRLWINKVREIWTERATLHSSSSASEAVIDMVNASATGGHC